mmetsp:Transcript_14160/g.25549  ORF Transcript_14160/g.25549 Transcript_14160/m.25549 type:complete len:303 (+) Transcript_14160:1388-2296(+)
MCDAHADGLGVPVARLVLYAGLLGRFERLLLPHHQAQRLAVDANDYFTPDFLGPVDLRIALDFVEELDELLRVGGALVQELAHLPSEHRVQHAVRVRLVLDAQHAAQLRRGGSILLVELLVVADDLAEQHGEPVAQQQRLDFFECLGARGRVGQVFGPGALLEDRGDGAQHQRQRRRVPLLRLLAVVQHAEDPGRDAHHVLHGLLAIPADVHHLQDRVLELGVGVYDESEEVDQVLFLLVVEARVRLEDVQQTLAEDSQMLQRVGALGERNVWHGRHRALCCWGLVETRCCALSRQALHLEK